jgi:hypothetical protein
MTVAAGAASGDGPLVRGPGTNRIEFEAFAEAQRRSTLAQALELDRPGKEAEEKLRNLLEKSQAAWLGHSLDAARSGFMEMAALAEEADWRDSQREAVFYAFMRLAQLASPSSGPSPSSLPSPMDPKDAEEWMKKAARLFPDLSPSPELFPPPLIRSFSEVHTRTLVAARAIDLKAHFPESRFVLVNGKKYDMSRRERLDLPTGRHRITALSDQHAPFTEKLTATQLGILRLNPPSIAQGSCQAPTGVGNLFEYDSLAVVYSGGCLRTRTSSGWLHPNGDLAELTSRPLDPAAASAMKESLFQDPEFERPRMKSKHWFWLGAGALITGAYLAHREANRDKAPAPMVPSHHRGF